MNALAARAEPERMLRLYLADHFAGATGGSELARRLARTHRDGPFGRELETFARDVAQDRQTLRSLMAALGIAPQRVKVAAAWTAERVGRLKPNGRIVRRSPLSNVLELEAMRMGVEGKASCWRALRLLADNDDRLSADELDSLIDRAEEQSTFLERLRVRTAAGVFGPAPAAGDLPRTAHRPSPA